MWVKQCGHSIGPSPGMFYTRHYIGLEIPIQTYVIVRISSNYGCVEFILLP
ncbi:hypothetical protein BsubNA05_25760 [Bacillus subtilis]|nr:hypothetical protein BsubNA05_25760 [Bacillus subtilis]